MKTIKQIVFLSLFLIGITNCNDSFLDRTPQDELTDESYWANENDVEMYTTSIYNYLIAPGDLVIMTDGYTDNALPLFAGASSGQISSGTADATTGDFKAAWEAAFSGIRRCNVFFEQIDRVSMDEGKRQIFIGEVKFLRAFFYATLLRLYGGVPILTKPLILNEAIPPRNSEEEVYEFIIQDLDGAAERLPNTRTIQTGRATKGAALSLKTIISLYFQRYDVTVNAAKQVMDLGVYGIFNHYGNLFLPEYENNEEVIFDRQFMDKSGQGSIIDIEFGPQMIGGWEALSPTQDLVDDYDCVDGKSITESPLYDPSNPFKNRDPRLAFSIMWRGCEFAGKIYEPVLGTNNTTRTGYNLRKYIIPVPSAGWNSWLNFIYIRYADVLLSYAEAQNELYGPDASVYDAVNRIRQRPGIDLPALSEGLTKDQMREVIRHERRVEFPFEGIHLYDTRRWKTTEAAVQKPVYRAPHEEEAGKVPTLIEKRTFDPKKHYLWAIPLTEISLSKGAIKQNPGY